MKALKDLFEVVALQSEGGEIAADLAMKADSEVYKAHFPGNAITPGACLIMAAGEIIEQASGKQLTLKVVKNVKFMSMVQPQDGGPIHYSIHMDWEALKVSAVVSLDERVCAKMAMSYVEGSL